MANLLLLIAATGLFGGAFLEDRARRRLKHSNESAALAGLPEGARVAARVEAMRERVVATRRSMWLLVMAVCALFALNWV